MPLLRLKTGDVASYHCEKCACGRNSWRLSPILGRKQQMMKVRGTTVYPPAIYAVLQKIDAVKNYYIEVRNDFELSERVNVVVGVDRQNSSITAKEIEEKIRGAVRILLDVEIKSVEYVAAKTVNENNRKPVLFFDFRNK